MKVLVVVDMQNDKITGPLGNADARAIVPKVLERVRNFDGMVLATKDTHFDNYFDTEEGKSLPVIHCVKGTPGWNLLRDLERLLVTPPIEKPLIVRSSRANDLPMCRSASGTTCSRSSLMNFFTATPDDAGVLSVSVAS